MQEQQTHTFIGVGQGTMQHLDQIFTGFPIKGVLAALPALFASHLSGDWHIFELWFVANAIDLVLGVVLTQKYARFSHRRVYGWVIKTFTHMLTIILVGIVSYTFASVSGYPAPILDWFMFILLLTEVASIIDSLGKLGLPVHPLAQKIISKIRRKSEVKLDELTGDEEYIEEEKKDETDI